MIEEGLCRTIEEQILKVAPKRKQIGSRKAIAINLLLEKKS
jgi:hypothetical protein